MSDGQLARLVSEGRDCLNESARNALDQELRERGLTDDCLAQEYPSPHIQPDALQRPSKRLSIEHFRLKGALRPWQMAAIALSLVAALTMTVMNLREAKMDQLYRTVLTGIDSREQRAAFNKLVTYRGRHACKLVLGIARARNMLDGDIQIDAVRFLGERGDSETAQLLATLLSPYEGIAVRAAVADSLLKLPCFAQCVRSVLDYRERIWRGDPSLENMFGVASKEIDEQLTQTDRKLDRLLLNHKRDTLAVLLETYGLGTIAVSPFALQEIEQLKLKEACEFLRVGQGVKVTPDVAHLFPSLDKAWHQINATRQELNCEVPPSAP